VAVGRDFSGAAAKSGHSAADAATDKNA